MQLFLKQAELRMHNAEAVAKIRVAAAEAGEGSPRALLPGPWPGFPFKLICPPGIGHRATRAGVRFRNLQTYGIRALELVRK